MKSPELEPLECAKFNHSTRLNGTKQPDRLCRVGDFISVPVVVVVVVVAIDCRLSLSCQCSRQGSKSRYQSSKS